MYWYSVYYKCEGDSYSRKVFIKADGYLQAMQKALAYIGKTKIHRIDIQYRSEEFLQ